METYKNLQKEIVEILNEEQELQELIEEYKWLSFELYYDQIKEATSQGADNE